MAAANDGQSESLGSDDTEPRSRSSSAGLDVAAMSAGGATPTEKAAANGPCSPPSASADAMEPSPVPLRAAVSARAARPTTTAAGGLNLKRVNLKKAEAAATAPPPADAEEPELMKPSLLTRLERNKTEQVQKAREAADEQARAPSVRASARAYGLWRSMRVFGRCTRVFDARRPPQRARTRANRLLFARAVDPRRRARGEGDECRSGGRPRVRARRRARDL
eukprot:5352928-Prymnesium_polylepis.1